MTIGHITTAHRQLNRIRQPHPPRGEECTCPPWAIVPPQHQRQMNAFAATRGDKSAGMSFPKKMHGTIWTPSNTWFLGLTRVHNPNGILIRFSYFCRVHDCDRQTDRPRYLVCISNMFWYKRHLQDSRILHQISLSTGTISCIYICSTAMWPNNCFNR